MEAPPGEDKLAMLSEIAQEHGVEWDAHNAALEMLPSDTSMQNASPGYQQQLLDITGAGGSSSNAKCCGYDNSVD